MHRITAGRRFPRPSTSFLPHLRNASTAQPKPKPKKSRIPSAQTTSGKGVGVNTTSSTTTTSTAAEAANASSSGHALSPNELSWVIEPKLGYWGARVRTPLSRGVILSVAALAVTSLSMPDPSTLPDSPPSDPTSKDEHDPKTAEPERSFLKLLLTPLTFIFRPILVPPEARAAAETTPLFWIGAGTGATALVLFGSAFFFAPRYTRSLSISPASLNPTKGGMLRFTPAWGRPVTVPLGDTVLVSPLVPGLKGKSRRGGRNVGVVGDGRDVLRTVAVEGNTLRGALLGWGLPMLRSGAVVNGKDVSQGEVVKLLEKIWLQRGGMIAVEGEKR
ncbi:hypothetical protein CVT26_002320 [Gymnopilus dilepis]|uniref:Uncharacterized protein n=1 Tax=Gymnopilus dilepis TaxID=231916 RepID=A0A409Y3M9_9AGAR|nr:hypothetical protein CVT26_002320 [Gymnopilus dilepis]